MLMFVVLLRFIVYRSRSSSSGVEQQAWLVPPAAATQLPVDRVVSQWLAT